MIFFIPGILFIIAAVLYFRQITSTNKTVINFMIPIVLMLYGSLFFINSF